MKIGVMTTFPKLYSTQRLLEEGRARGHDMHVINTLQCYMDITQVEPMVYFRKKPLNDFDAVIPRISSAITFYGTAVLRQFEMMGVFPLNESNAIGRSRDKLRALQLLSRKGVGLPSTSFAHSTKQTKDLIKLVGGAPCVIKLLEGSQGRGVVLAETQKAAESVIDAFREMSANFLVQQFIKEAGGSDIRCFVIGDKVVASMMRTAKEGEFRSNLHRGGSAKEIRITSAERAMAIKAALAMGLHVAGVDIIRAEDGPKIIEVNSSPGLEGIETTTGKNVAGMIIEFIEKNRTSRKTNVKGRG